MEKNTTNGTRKIKRKRRSAIFEPCHINPKYFSDEFAEKFKEGFKDDNTPFPHWQIRNFVENSDNIVEKIENELQGFKEWSRKENDLYSLYQTNDLKAICPLKYPFIYTFRQFLYNEVRTWLEQTSGVKLTTQVDSNGSCYAHTDSLLPHNDLIETRRFAFVYYLTSPNWKSKAHGGNLLLYKSDKNFNPTAVERELVPYRNSLVLFEVSEKSWHRVAEMISNEPRLSINGWFHSTRRITPKKPQPEQLHKFLPEKKMKVSKLINSEYLKTERQNQVQQIFADNSELNLQNFLLNEIHQNVHSELTSNSNIFDYIGPVNKRNVARISDSKIKALNHTLRLSDCLKSKNFSKLVEKLSGVSLNGAKCSFKISRIEKGTYWVLGDEDAEQSTNDGYCLDVHVFVQSSKWDLDAGGELIYIADGEEEELLRISPNPNCASLIFREPGVISFLKLANCKSGEPYFLFTVSFYNVQVADDE